MNTNPLLTAALLVPLVSCVASTPSSASSSSQQPVGALRTSQAPAAGAAQATPATAPLATPPSTSMFYDSLSPYGDWVEAAPYGWVWTPRDVAPGWRPYTDGAWNYCDDYGWVWVGAEPWAWAPYHYGRWYMDAQLGWAWAPGTEWGPAWVEWRRGPEYVGWAPLSPACGWGVGVGLRRGDVELGVDAWAFTSYADFGARSLREHLILAARNPTLIARSERIEDAYLREGHAFDRGLAPEWVEKHGGHGFARVALSDASRPGPVQRTDATHLAMYRARLQPAAADVRPLAEAARRGEHALSESEYAEFRSRETQRYEQFHQDELKRLQDLHAKELGQAQGEAAVRDLRAQHAAEIARLQAQHARELEILHSRQARQVQHIRRRAG